MFYIFYCLFSIAFARDTIAILISDNLPEYQEPAQAFIEAYGGTTQTFHLEGDKGKALKITRDLREDPPLMVFAIGAKAAYITKQELPFIPMVYAMIHEPSKYGIYGDNVTGISNNPAPELTLAQFRLFVPKAKTIAFFISESASIEVVSNATETAKSMGFKTKLIRVNSSMELRKSLSYISKEADAIWLLPDPLIITPENFHYISSIATRSKIPVLTNSELLTQAGALMSITPDRSGVGQQAADIINAMLQDEAEYGGSTFLPETPHITFNEGTQKNIGLEIDAFAKGFIDEIVQ